MAKRLSEKQKEEILKLFNEGINIYALSLKFNCTKLTISRNLKKQLGEDKYKEIVIKNKPMAKFPIHKKEEINHEGTKQILDSKEINEEIYGKSLNRKEEKGLLPINEFIEIVPLDLDIENLPQKDLTSSPISSFNFPKSVFMIVDKKAELEIKYLKDYPQWQFLSKDELKRKTIEIYFDLKVAKSLCGKEQKVIKVPNTDVFKVAAPVLRAKGISRIVGSDHLIAL